MDRTLQIRRSGLVGYQEAWGRQRQRHEARVAGQVGDLVWLLEHPPVYTAGRRTAAEERPTDGSPVVEVDRGGKITYHGPGQLVGYPIVALPSHVYVVDYVRRIEEALIRACTDLGLITGRIPGRSGVWVPGGGGRDRKVAALGVRVSRGVTMHGFAVNCNVDLAAYDAIVPCGISDAGVTSLSVELGRDVSVDEAAALVQPQLRELLAWGPYPRSPDLDDSVEARGLAAYGLPTLGI